MIIVIEGLEGTGKTTLATALARRLAVPVYRPFRASVVERWGDGNGTEKLLKRYGVPYNTIADDFYVADALARFRVDAILDRSMPSGLAYSAGLRKEEMDAALFWWYGKLRPLGFLYIHLVVPRDVAADRVGYRAGDPWRWEQLLSRLNYCRERLQDADARTLYVDATTPAENVLEYVCRSLKS